MAWNRKELDFMWEELKNQTVLVTGATGLIGQEIVKQLLSCDAKVIAVVRSLEKARSLFGDSEKITFIVSDISTLKAQNLDIDYIIHGAANTSSRAFVQKPVEIVFSTLEGMRSTLEIAKLNAVKGYVFLSSMEVYGAPTSDEKIDEMHSSNLNSMEARSCYPESKRICETLCASYFKQFGIPAKVVRLTQTIGPGVKYNDNRVFAEFARCVIENRDIILHTKGETKRCYLYTEDAADAILTVLLKGVPGEAYNAANEETSCSIYEMASRVSNNCGNGNIKVVIKEEDSLDSFGYAPKLYMNLDSLKLRSLGWKPTTGLTEMYLRLIESMRKGNSKNNPI